MTHGSQRPPRARAGALALLALCLPACMFDLPDVVPSSPEPRGDAGADTGTEAGAPPTDDDLAPLCEAAGMSLIPGNLLKNPSFEQGVLDNSSGWGSADARLLQERDAGAPHGGFVARVSFAGTTTDAEYHLKDDPRTVRSGRGLRFVACAWVRHAPETGPSDEKKTMIISIRQSDDVVLASTSLEVGTGGFTLLGASGASTEDGKNIGVRVAQSAPSAGDAFEVDLIQLVQYVPRSSGEDD